MGKSLGGRGEACGAGKLPEGSAYRALAPDRPPRAPCDPVAADKTVPQTLCWAVEGLGELPGTLSLPAVRQVFGNRLKVTRPLNGEARGLSEQTRSHQHRKRAFILQAVCPGGVDRPRKPRASQFYGFFFKIPCSLQRCKKA